MLTQCPRCGEEGEMLVAGPEPDHEDMYVWDIRHCQRCDVSYPALSGGPVAQRSEQAPHKRKAPGSSPGGSTKGR